MNIIELEMVFHSIDLYEFPSIPRYQSTAPHPIEQVVDDNIVMLSLLGLPNQGRQVRYTVFSRWISCSHKFRQGRHKVVVSAQVIRFRTGRDAASQRTIIGHCIPP